MGLTYVTNTFTTTGALTGLSINGSDTNVSIVINGTYTGVSFTVEGTYDGTNWQKIGVTDVSSGNFIAGNSTISPADTSTYSWSFVNAANFGGIRLNVSAITGGTATVKYYASQIVTQPYIVISQGAGAFSNITASGTLAVTGATTLGSTLAVTGATTLGSTAAITGNVTVNTNKLTITAASGNLSSAGSILSTSATGGVGYATGSGGAVTQATSRTTGVTLNTPTGAITLVSAAGSATPFSFTVTNSSVAATDTVVVNQKSGTDIYTTQVVTAVAAGSFRLTLANASGTTTEQPVFNYTVFKGVIS